MLSGPKLHVMSCKWQVIRDLQSGIRTDYDEHLAMKEEMIVAKEKEIAAITRELEVSGLLQLESVKWSTILEILIMQIS